MYKYLWSGFATNLWMLLAYRVAKACTSSRNSTGFTTPFLLMRGWGLGTRLTSVRLTYCLLWWCTAQAVLLPLLNWWSRLSRGSLLGSGLPFGQILAGYPVGTRKGGRGNGMVCTCVRRERGGKEDGRQVGIKERERNKKVKEMEGV